MLIIILSEFIIEIIPEAIITIIWIFRRFRVQKAMWAELDHTITEHTPKFEVISKLGKEISILYSNEIKCGNIDMMLLKYSDLKG